MSKSAKESYLLLQKTNELTQVFPKATGDWETDREKFIIACNETIKFIHDFEQGDIDDTTYD